MLRGNPQANRSAVIENVDCEPLQADNFGEAADRPRQIVERISEVTAGRHVRLTKAGQVGDHEVKAVGKERVRSRNMWPALGKPCSRSSVGASVRPASR